MNAVDIILELYKKKVTDISNKGTYMYIPGSVDDNIHLMFDIKQLQILDKEDLDKLRSYNLYFMNPPYEFRGFRKYVSIPYWLVKFIKSEGVFYEFCPPARIYSEATTKYEEGIMKEISIDQWTKRKGYDCKIYPYYKTINKLEMWLKQEY